MLDERTPTDIRRALRRSRIRVAVLLALLRLGQAYAADLARLANVDPKWVSGALYGDGEDYKHRDGLVVMGLVTARDDDAGVIYALSARGAAIAKQLRQEMIRELLLEPKVRT